MLQNVYVVDDDHHVRSSLSFILDTDQLKSRAFAGGQEFLSAIPELGAGCILLDVRMPVFDGFYVMSELSKADVAWPVIVMTGHGEITMAVKAMKLGAVDFIEKPFDDVVLLETLKRAFQLLEDSGAKAEGKRVAKEKVARLTPREKEVLQALTGGLPNKLIARQLDISLRTVEMHRANMMNSLQASSLAEALLLAVQAEI